MSKRALACFVLLFSVSLPARPQQTSPSPQPPPGQQSAATQPQKPDTQTPNDTDVVRIRTNLVQIDAVVTKDGKQVTDLTAEDFEIFEDGRKQTITNFSYVSNVSASLADTTVKPAAKKDVVPFVPPAIRPEDTRRTIALVVDDLGMSTESMAALKGQLRKFIEEQVELNDLVAIIRTGGEVGALQQFTTDKRLLYRAVDRLRRNPCSRVGTTVFGPMTGSNNGVALCANETMRLSTRYLGAHSDEHLLYCDWNKRYELLVSKGQFEDDLEKNYTAMQAFGVSKNDARFFLPPFEWYNRSISDWTNGIGLRLINFTPGTRSNADYTTPAMKNYVSSKVIMQRIKEYEGQDPAGLNGFIFLVHIGVAPERTDKFYDHLDELIGWLRRNKYQMVRIDQLLKASSN